MEKLLDLLSQQVNQIDQRLDSIDKTLILNTKSLEDHIKRTAILEAQVEPIVSHVRFIKTLGVLIGAIFSLVTALLGILALYRKL